jgi:hypothetical protein
MLPNVFIVGAAKSGTTTVADLLRQHPEVAVPEVKEPHFLLPEQIRRTLPTAVDNREEYEALYKGAKSIPHRVDASVLYLPFASACAPKIRELAGPEAKIIILLREPLARARSAYRHFLRYNSTDLGSFAQAIATEPELGDGNPMRCFSQLSQYVNAVQTYQSHFHNVLVVTTDALKRNPSAFLDQIWKFLDIEAADVTPRNLNVGDFEWRTDAIRKTVNAFMPPRTRAFLRKTMPRVYETAQGWTVRHLGRQPQSDLTVTAEVAAFFATERARIARELGIHFKEPEHD